MSAIQELIRFHRVSHSKQWVIALRRWFLLKELPCSWGNFIFSRNFFDLYSYNVAPSWMLIQNWKLESPWENIGFGCVYRPPNQNGSLIIEKFNDILSKDNKQCHHHTPTQEFTDTLFSHAFIPLISSPKRLTSYPTTQFKVRLLAKISKNSTKTFQTLTGLHFSGKIPT